MQEFKCSNKYTVLNNCDIKCLISHFHTAIAMAILLSISLNPFPHSDSDSDSLLDYIGIAITIAIANKWVEYPLVNDVAIAIANYIQESLSLS